MKRTHSVPRKVSLLMPLSAAGFFWYAFTHPEGGFPIPLPVTHFI